MKSKLMLWAFMVPIFMGLYSCVKTKNEAVPITITNNIKKNFTFKTDSIYIIDGWIYVDNSSIVTIQPGATLKFNNESRLIFGNSSNATVIANGTAEKPIVFTSSAAAPTSGSWDGLYFYDNVLQNSSMKYCKIEYAGNSGEAVKLYHCDITMENCTIKNIKGSGINTKYLNSKGGFVSFKNNSISLCEEYALIIDAQKLGIVDASNTFSDALGISVEGDLSNSTNASLTWKKLSLPYIIDDWIYIDGYLKIEPGTVFNFTNNGYLLIGNSNNTTFIAEGTEASPIIFSTNALLPAPGSWYGIKFYSNTLANTSLKYCEFKYAGKDSYSPISVSTDKQITVSYCKFIECSVTTGDISYGTPEPTGTSTNNFTWK